MKCFIHGFLDVPGGGHTRFFGRTGGGHTRVGIPWKFRGGLPRRVRRRSLRPQQINVSRAVCSDSSSQKFSLRRRTIAMAPASSRRPAT